MLVVPLRYKLLLLLFATVAAALVSVGLALYSYGNAQFEQETEHRFSETRRALIGRLQELEQKAHAQAKEVAERLDVIATVNLVYAYQSPRRYQPMVFDGEKKELALALGRQLLGVAQGTDDRLITVYDAHGELVSFALADGGSPQFGFISYEKGKPVPYLSRRDAATWTRLPVLPETCVEEGAPSLDSGYGQCAGRFVLRAVAPIERRFPSGASLLVGRVVLSQYIGDELAGQIFAKTGTRLSLYLRKRLLGGTLDVPVLDESLVRAAVPLLRDAQRSSVEGGRYLLQSHSIPLGSALNAYLLMGIDRYELKAEQQALQEVILRVAAVALGVTIPAALLFSWWFGRPARRYAEHVKAVSEGRTQERLPVPGDGLGRLAGAAQEIAFALHAQGSHQQALALEKERVAHLEEAACGLQGVVEVLAAALERHTVHRPGHQARVATLTVAIGERLGLSGSDLQGLRLGALVHDLGEMAVPASLLSKRETFGPVEMTRVRLHPKAGYALLKDLQAPWPIALMAFQHHERLDGSGYPMGLKGEDIILPARILAVAEVVEAMVSKRPHREALGLERALAEIEGQSGNLYDPRVVEACAALLRDEGFVW